MSFRKISAILTLSASVLLAAGVQSGKADQRLKAAAPEQKVVKKEDSIIKTYDLSSGTAEIRISNFKTNILKFPFIVHKANLVTDHPDNFTVTSKNYSVVIIPTLEDPKNRTEDLVIWSAEGDPYLIRIHSDGKDQLFPFSLNEATRVTNVKAARFETGMIESDIKNIVKKLAAGQKLPGYKTVKVKKIFKTPDLYMQKDVMYDGGKYRAEEWYFKNISQENLLLEYENFYAPGIIGMAIKKKTLKPGEITKGWIIIDKNTIYQLKKKRG